MTGLDFFSNEEQLGGKTDDLKNTIILGNGRIKIFHESNLSNRIIAASFIDQSIIIENSNTEFNIIKINGMPLSISLCNDFERNPSENLGIGIFYALDVIVNNNLTDTQDLNTAQNPPATTPNIGGTQIEASKIDDLYYLKIYNINSISDPVEKFTFYGVPMAYGEENELILNQSSYTMNDISEMTEFNLGGTIIQAGLVRSENKYFLIVTEEEIS